MTLQDIYEVIQKIAPFETQMDFDNAGMLIGSPDRKVHHVGVVLDVTMEAVKFAVEQGIDCIVSHHPVIFSPLKLIKEDSVVYQLIHHGIGVISAHTNLDAATDGVNDVLAKTLGLSDVKPLGLPFETTPAMGRVGKLTGEMKTQDFAEFICKTLNTHVKYSGTKQTITTVAVCGGAGADFIEPAMVAGADALVTSEVKHHQWLSIQPEDFILVDAGHFETEQVIVRPLAEMLKRQLDVSVTIIPQSSPVVYC